MVFSLDVNQDWHFGDAIGPTAVASQLDVSPPRR